MIVIICVIAAVLFISLYDHFSSRSWQQVTSTTRNDTVFEKRNRDYGAYAIRRDYDKRLMLIVLAIAGGAGVLYAATRKEEIVKVAPPKTVDIETIIDFDDADKPELPETRPEEPAASAPAQTLAFPPPTVSDSDPTEPIDIPDGTAQVGLVATPPGDDPGFLPAGPPSTGSGTQIVERTVIPEGPVIPDEPAEYIGGINKMRQFIADNMHYPQAPLELGIGGKCYLRFVVSTAGDISDVTVMRGVPDCPECDKEAKRVIKIMPRWRPGRVKGKPVDSYFNIPITFQPH